MKHCIHFSNSIQYDLKAYDRRRYCGILIFYVNFFKKEATLLKTGRTRFFFLILVFQLLFTLCGHEQQNNIKFQIQFESESNEMKQIMNVLFIECKKFTEMITTVKLFFQWIIVIRMTEITLYLFFLCIINNIINNYYVLI